MLLGKTFTPKVLRVLRRRIWSILVPFAVVAAATALSARWLPDRYRSETRILLVSQRAPDTDGKSIVTARIEDRLPPLTRQILNRTGLDRIIHDFNLYGADRQTGNMAKMVERMRDDITVQVVTGNVFRVAYVGDNAVTVMRVTDRLASLFIEQNGRDQDVSAEGTNHSFEAQIEDARRRLVEHEKKLEAYQQRFSAGLRSQLTSNLEVIQNTQAQAQAMVESINRDKERRLLVERQLHDAEREPEAIDSPPPDREVEPKVQAEAGAQSGLIADSGQTPVSLVDNSRERVTELRAELEQLDRQLAFKEAENRRLRGVAVSYQERVNGVQTREAELAELTQDYSTLQAMYTALLSKQEASKTVANLDGRRIGEQFKLVAPARMLEEPFSSNRKRITLMGVAGGLVLGFAFVVLLEYRDRTFHGDTEVVKALRLPVLAVVPLMQSKIEHRQALRRQLTVDCGLGSIVVACLSLVVYTLLY
jgi:uncharacterized protein involved in exopolysaccharide biosynthesis